jgi:hypothetical protein
MLKKVPEERSIHFLAHQNQQSEQGHFGLQQESADLNQICESFWIKFFHFLYVFVFVPVWQMQA